MLTTEARGRLLLDIFRRTRGTLNLRETLDRLLDGLRLLVPFDAGGIFILREEMSPPRAGPLTQQIAGVSWSGFTPRSPLTDPMLREGRGIVGHVIRSGETVRARDVREDPRYIMGREATLSEVAVPILLDGRTIGALNLESDQLDAFSRSDVEVLRFFADATAIAVEKATLHERLLEAERVDRQLLHAQQVQSWLLPSTSPEVHGYELAGLCLPSARVGGDYFDYVPLPDGKLGLVVADVSGHGLSAALIMSAFRVLVRTCLRSGHALDEVARTLHRELPDTTAGNAFVTAFLAVLDPVSGRIDYVNCGHHPAILDRAGATAMRLDRGGPLLGPWIEERFEVAEASLSAGDQLVIFTDGLVEARNPEGDWFESDRLVELVAGHRKLPARDMVESIILEARAFAGVADFEDDVTLLAVRRVG